MSSPTPADDRIRVLLVDDHALVRTGFRMVLDHQADMTVVGEAADGAQAVQAARQLRPDVVVTDIRMPVMDGVEATRQIVASLPSTRVLVLTTFDLDEYVHASLRAGAAGFLLKDAGPAELLAAIRAVHAGDAVVAPAATRRLLERFLPSLPAGGRADNAAARAVAGLTEREREVLAAVGQGLTNGEIAAELYLAETTIKTHIGHILAKLGVRDRVGMVIAAYDAGIVQPRG